MADFSALKEAIQDYIKQNGNEEITGEKLQTILLSIVNTLGDSAINDLITALNAEVAARQNADGSLQGAINQEGTLRSNADSTLQGNINAEATARANGDTALSNRLGSSITAENTAAEQIGAEAEAREAADTALQGLIDGITDNIENGYVYAGIATPSTTPVTGKVFYLALTAGTYTHFGSTVVSQGINILKYNGSAWSLDAFIGIDDELTTGSNNLPKSGNVLENIIKNGSAFDLSAYNAVDGVLATYADLDAALTALNALPAVYKQGGMSMKFVLTSDNKYVQYRCMAQNFTTDVTQWQGVEAEPTDGSANLVNGNGILGSIRKHTFLPVDYTTITTSNLELISGYSLSQSGLVSGTGRSYYRMLLRNERGLIDKVKVTAREDVGFTIAFAKNVSSTNVIPADSEIHFVSAGKTEFFDVPSNTNIILINNHSTTDVFPVYVGFLVNYLQGGNLKEYVDTKVLDYNNFSDVVFKNNIVAFTDSEMNEGTVLSYKLVLTGLATGGGNGHWGWISFCDVNGTVLGQIGKTTTATTAVVFEGEYTIPTGFSYAKVVTDLVAGISLSITTDKHLNIDQFPTYDSKDYVESGGVWKDIREKTYLPNSFTALTTAEMELIEGKSVTYNNVTTGDNRSCYRMLTRNFAYIPRKLKVTAGTNNAMIVFVKVLNGTFIVSVDNTNHTVPAGTTEIIDIPINTMGIIINNYTTANVYPTYIGVMCDEIRGNDIQGYVNVKTQDYSNIDGSYSNNFVLFTKDEVAVGDKYNWDITINNTVDGSNNYALIMFRSSNGSNILSIGKQFAPSDVHLTGMVVIPEGYEYAQVLTSVADGLSIKFTKIVNEGEFGSYTEYDLTQALTATDCFINPQSKDWRVSSAHANRVWKIIEIPSAASFIKIVTKINKACYCAFLSSWKTPEEGLYPDYAEVNKTTGTYIGNVELEIPSAAKYFILMTHNTTEDVTPDYIGFSTSSTLLESTLEQKDSLIANGRQIESVSCPNAAVEVMSSQDEDATQYDNLLINGISVVKVRDNLFYMYYNCFGVTEYGSDNIQHLAFAYSTDGINWTRGFPQGIEAPIAGTNLIINSDAIGVQVFMVQDENYPFRMVASKYYSSLDLYKSSDGVHFTKVRTIFPYYCDNQVSCIVRGNIVKVYLRWRSDSTGESTVDETYRWIGVFTMDINGNIICPPTTFFGLNLYQASASILDERREIAFPTYFNPNVDEQEIQCFIIDGMNIKRVLLDTSNIIANNELSFYAAPALINIGSKMYLYVATRTQSHNTFSAECVCRIKRVEVVFDVEGRPHVIPS